MDNKNIPTEEEFEKAKQEMRALGAKNDYKTLASYYEKYRILFTHNPEKKICQMLYICAKDLYAASLSNQSSPEHLEKSLKLYTQMTFEMPATELFRENAAIVERKLKAYLQDLGAKLDYVTLGKEYEKYKTLANEHREMAVYVRLSDWTESQYAYALCRQDDIDHKKEALVYYKDLARRHPEEPTHTQNRDITKQQIKQLKKG